VDDIAISVLATVVSHRRENRRILVDAGGLALSKDTSANDFLPDAGYGWVCDPVTTERIGDLRIARVDQEHGFVEGDSLPYGLLPIGSRVRILPNHACMTAAAHREYLIVDEDDEIIDTWDRANGW
jgi:D-serine deaminase-like pyridoxal phosphate-dependent protein